MTDIRVRTAVNNRAWRGHLSGGARGVGRVLIHNRATGEWAAFHNGTRIGIYPDESIARAWLETPEIDVPVHRKPDPHRSNSTTAEAAPHDPLSLTPELEARLYRTLYQSMRRQRDEVSRLLAELLEVLPDRSLNGVEP